MTYHYQPQWALKFVLLSLTFLTLNLSGQKLSDYVILAGDPNSSFNEASVYGGNYSNIIGGEIGSYSNMLFGSCESYPYNPFDTASSCAVPGLPLISNSFWLESSVSLPNPPGSNWYGVASLPAASTFNSPAATGPSYPNINGRPKVEGTQNIIAENNIRFFRQQFTLFSDTAIQAEFTMYFDDNVEVYINNKRLFRQQKAQYSTFTGVPHYLRINDNGTVVNGGPGYDAFDFTFPVDLDTVLKVGQNTITVVVRNFSGASNKGGFSLKMNLSQNGLPLIIEAGGLEAAKDQSVNLMHSGGLQALGQIHMSGNNGVGGIVTAGNLGNSGSFTVLATSASDFDGDLFVNGNTLIVPGSVMGTVTYPSGSVYGGPQPLGGEVIGPVISPNLPGYPFISSLPLPAPVSVSGSTSLSPGIHGGLHLSGGATINLSGTGDYIFNEIRNSGINTFNFDFNNQPTGAFRILVKKGVELAKLQVNLLNGGDASRILLEVQGTDSTTEAFRLQGEWYGTVWTPYGSIRVDGGADTARVVGALLSHKAVKISHCEISHMPYDFCSGFNVQATAADSVNCSNPTVVLNGTTSAIGASVRWTTSTGYIVSGANTLSPLVSKSGLYILAVTDPKGCVEKDSVEVPGTQCIQPAFTPPDSGKVGNLIGSELNALANNPGFQDTVGNIFIRQGDSVFIEVISIAGKYNTLLSLLQTPAYGMTRLINNGSATLIISGLFPIQNLRKLDSLPGLINYVRPLFPPLVNGGIAQSQGDAAVRADFAREAFSTYGENVRIGVLSDSYNTKPGNPAQIDISNGDLPGPGNSENSNPVKVLKEYPYGPRTDEGRAMLQIVHDLAPKAELVFRTGYISAGDFAQGILAMWADSCDIICDDITYITEPFLTDGVVAQAVNQATAQGISYFSSAGNFGDKSYASNFNPTTAPSGVKGVAHDFGGGDLLQRVSLQPGNYTIVLQWQDSIYSIGQTSKGTQNDLDIFLTDDFGNVLFGFNRNNLSGDPLEILSFRVTQATQSNIMVIRSTGTQNVYFKYIIFQGNITIDEYQTGNSTVVGQANAEGAIAVGAALYSNTPAFGANPPTVASFSSLGGTPVNGVARNKPDLVAPNGVNTTVNLGGQDIESDGLPNFFGTSAAAPHAAAVAALVKSGMQKFENTNLSPTVLKNMLTSNSIDMANPGFDFKTGNGLVEAYNVLTSVASPTPKVTNLSLDDSSKTAGTDTVILVIRGNYFNSQTKVLFRDDTVATTFLSQNELRTVIPPFSGNPAIRAYTAPITSSMLDGGFSDSLFFFTPIKTKVQVVAHNQTKKYGEDIPNLTFEVLVDSVTLNSSSYSLSQLGLDSLIVTSTANSLSNVGLYAIRPQLPTFNSNDGFTELFDYQTVDAILDITRMPLTITPADTILLETQGIGDFRYIYQLNDSLINPVNRALILNAIENDYESSLSEEKGYIDNTRTARGRALVNADLEGKTFVVSEQSELYARPLVNAFSNDTTYLVDVATEALFNYEAGLDSVKLVNAYPLVNARALVNALALVNGLALVNARPLVNAYPLVNGYPLVNAYPLVNNVAVNPDSTEVLVIVDSTDTDTTFTDTTLSTRPITLITGVEPGVHTIVPGPFFNSNYQVTYKLGDLIILPGGDTLSFVTDTSWRKSASTTTSTANQYPWMGVGGLLPSISSFALPVMTGQPYPWKTIDSLDGAYNLKAGTAISYFRKSFNLSAGYGRTLRFQSYMDDGVEIYLNGHWLLREGDRSPRNYKGTYHDAVVRSTGEIENSFEGGDAFDFVNEQPLDSILHKGENELIVVLRNGLRDLGGFSMIVSVGYDSLRLNKNAVISSVEGAQLNLQMYPNPVAEQLTLEFNQVKTESSVSVWIYDNQGKLLLSELYSDLNPGELREMDLSQLPAGIYSLRVFDGESVAVKKLLIAR